MASPQSNIQKLFSFKTHTAVSPDSVQEESVTRTNILKEREFHEKSAKEFGDMFENHKLHSRRLTK